MTTIYVVTDGEYSDYHICGVFDNENLAQKLIDAICGSGRIEEYELNPHERELEAGYKPFMVRMDRNGNTIQVDMHKVHFAHDNDNYMFDRNGNMVIECMARDRIHAIKIANERRAMLIASGRWPA